MNIGKIKIFDYLVKVNGRVSGQVITDAKYRHYYRDYKFHELDEHHIEVQRADGYGDKVILAKEIELDESLVAFLGLYSGDGSKGQEDKNEPGRIIPNISFSQRQRHLVRFAVDQFRRLFPGEIRFTFSLGEDSAYFLEGLGLERLKNHYLNFKKVEIPKLLSLDKVRPELNEKDKQYLAEIRFDLEDTNENYLAFYYQHKKAMEEIFTADKLAELESVDLYKADDIKVTASLRRPFKKGARKPGGSSRSDEIHIGGLNGMGELFLKIMHEVEDSILSNTISSPQGLIEWNNSPEKVGNILNVKEFFEYNSYGVINGERPKKLENDLVTGKLVGQWRRSKEIFLKESMYLNPLWCYVSGLYLAEGTTPKDALFEMFKKSPGSLALGFTSSEGASLELMLRALNQIFYRDSCLEGWKVKVGSQYFPELVVTGLKQGVPMLRGGNSGDGKLRTMEISISIKEWALNVADDPLKEQSLLSKNYANKYSHVEPTGAGVARIDFWASSVLCRWYFPLLMFTVFGNIVKNPLEEFYA